MTKSAGVQTFLSNAGASLRVLAGDDSEPWFVALDVMAALDVHRSSIGLLDDDERGIRALDTPAGPRGLAVVSEAGLYSLILRSRKPAAKAFKRWVTHEVLPAVRRHGLYAAPVTVEAILRDPDTMIRALEALKTERDARQEAEREAAAKTAELEEAAPKASAWDVFMSGNGDMSVADAAKALAGAGVPVGRDRLFRWLLDQGWAFRGPDSAPRAMQTRIDAGHLRHKAHGHFHPATGEWVIDPPQIRVTPKGLDLLARRLAPLERAA
ncbi:MAG: phage antirepressor KilAC domain-containing protein [Propionibacteriaceae bacterium]|jgi:prophage antirepressor-like protein|nr:phage antirepressor KilAC domain-containing protein [Propionibacteriaceae bacterium]